MNQLQSELRLARSLIAERDAEVQRVSSTNNQVLQKTGIVRNSLDLFKILNYLCFVLFCFVRWCSILKKTKG